MLSIVSSKPNKAILTNTNKAIINNLLIMRRMRTFLRRTRGTSVQGNCRLWGDDVGGAYTQGGVNVEVENCVHGCKDGHAQKHGPCAETWAYRKEPATDRRISGHV